MAMHRMETLLTVILTAMFLMAILMAILDLFLRWR